MVSAKVGAALRSAARPLAQRLGSPAQSSVFIRCVQGPSQPRTAAFERDLFQDADVDQPQQYRRPGSGGSQHPSQRRNNPQRRLPSGRSSGGRSDTQRPRQDANSSHRSIPELAALKSALNPEGPSTSAHQGRGDPGDVARAVQGLISQGDGDLLEPYLSSIFRAVAPAVRSPSGIAESDALPIAGTLCHIWMRVFQLWHTTETTPDGLDRREVGELLAQFLINSAACHGAGAMDDETVGRIQAIFLDLLRRTKQARLVNRLPTPFIAAWAVLRQRCAGGTEQSRSDLTSSPVLHGSPEKVFSYIARTLGVDNSDAQARFSPAIQELQDLAADRPFPSTPDELNSALARMRLGRDTAGRLRLWEQYKAAIRSEPSPKRGSCFDPVNRDKVLSAFLQTFVTGGNRPSQSNDGLDQALQELLNILPRPLPRQVFHAFLARRADADGSLSTHPTDAIRPLDDISDSAAGPQEDGVQDRALANLRETWELARDTPKDVKMYMIYMEGLGRYGDLDGIQQAWVELASDQQCRRLFATEQGLDVAQVAFPPVEALNQMISSTLLIPKHGPTVALDLFEQARAPTSAIPINITTLNIVLRHHARMADIPAMTALFGVAGEHKLAPDVVTYTTFVQGLLRARETDKARLAIEAMLDDGVEPNERIWSMLVADTAKRGDKQGLQGAEAIIAEMKDRGIRVSVVTWTGLISGYFRGGWEADGWDAVERMVQAGQKPTLVAYNMIVREAGLRPDAIASDDPITLKLLRKMIHAGVEPNSDTYVILLGPLIAAKNWRAAEKVLREMQNLGFAPEKAQLKRLVNLVRNSRKG